MPNDKYVRGRKLEYDVKDYLTAAGYNATRTAGSHGLYDVIGFNLFKTILVQCKHTTKKEINLKEILKGNNIILFEDLQVPIDYVKLLVMKQKNSNEFLVLYWDTDNLRWRSSSLSNF